jgi:hypothetical protein
MTAKTIRTTALLAVTLLFVILPMRAKGDDPSPRVIEFWPQGAPGATGTSDEDRPAIIPFTEEDRREWHEYARKRNLSPSIEGQRIYRRQRPKDKNELTAEIKAGVENRLQIEVFSR